MDTIHKLELHASRLDLLLIESALETLRDNIESDLIGVTDNINEMLEQISILKKENN